MQRGGMVSGGQKPWNGFDGMVLATINLSDARGSATSVLRNGCFDNPELTRVRRLLDSLSTWKHRPRQQN